MTKFCGFSGLDVLIFIFRGILGGAWVLLLSLCSEVTPSSYQESMRCCGLNLGLPAFKAYTQLIRAIRLASGFVFLKVEIVKLEVRMVFWKAKLPGVKLLWLQGKRMKEAEEYYAIFFHMC